MASRSRESVGEDTAPAHGDRLDADRLRSLRRGPRLRDYVDSVVEVLRGLPSGGPPPVVVGHSMGGGVVQHLVGRLDRPALGGAVLLASMPPAGVWRVTLDTARQRTATFLAANVRRDLGMLVVEPEDVRRMFLSPDTHEAVVEAVQSRLHGESFRAFLDMLALDRPRPASGRGPRATEVRVLGAADDLPRRRCRGHRGRVGHRGRDRPRHRARRDARPRLGAGRRPGHRLGA